MRQAGHYAVWGGFLGASLAICLPEIHWTLYTIAAAISAFGVVLLQRERRVAAQEHAADDTQLHRMETALEDIQKALSQLQPQVCEDKLHTLPAAIDQKALPAINAVVTTREAVLHRYGAQVYAEVMSPFAMGERHINRAWCAATDGYIDEVRRSLNQATTFMGETQRVISSLPEANGAQAVYA